MVENQRNFRKKRIGIVSSNKADKTIAVCIARKIKHRVYRKHINKTTKVLAHDEKQECSIGDKVLLMETRPLSKRKCWRLVTILQKKQ